MSNSQEVRIAGLIAAHIDNEEHLQCFKLCLQSIESQTRPLDFFGLSWSCESKFFIRCNNIVTSFRKSEKLADANLCFNYEPRKTTQFRHYEKLFLKVDVSVNFVIFGDSYVIWGPQRVSKTAELMQQTTSSVVLPYYLGPSKFTASLSLAQLHRDIEHLSFCGSSCTHSPVDFQIRMNDVNEFSTEEGSSFEIWQWCISWNLVRSFFALVPAYDNAVFMPNYKISVLDYEWCDLAFGAFMHRNYNFRSYHHERGSWYKFKIVRAGEANQFVWDKAEAELTWEKKVRAIHFPNDVDPKSVQCTTRYL